MGYPLALAFRYLGSKKRAMLSVGTAFAILGLTLGVAALAIVMSVTGGFQEKFREKVLGVNAHVILLKYSIDFPEYRDVMAKVRGVKGVIESPLPHQRGDGDTRPADGDRRPAQRGQPGAHGPGARPSQVHHRGEPR